ncbi:hypothetical protein, partial [Pseudomonas fluorescens]|uniref:hypothetical protein n=1 Tax=Pseudomonas fluorescens TaxID=294 RepID=UPI0019594E94
CEDAFAGKPGSYRGAVSFRDFVFTGKAQHRCKAGVGFFFVAFISGSGEWRHPTGYLRSGTSPKP